MKKGTKNLITYTWETEIEKEGGDINREDGKGEFLGLTPKIRSISQLKMFNLVSSRDQR